LESFTATKTLSGDFSIQVILMRAIVLLVFLVAFGYAALRVWLRKSNARDSENRSDGFLPRIGFTRLDGMESLSLLLANENRTHVWAEEIEITLSNLVAISQTAEPSLHEIQKIRQLIPPGDTQPISLAGMIYKAAGEPQRRHSSVLSSVIRYRIGEKWFEKNLDNYRIRMIGLTASGVQRQRKAVQGSKQPSGKSQPIQAMAAKTR
jgi:hypothetical protein